MAFDLTSFFSVDKGRHFTIQLWIVYKIHGWITKQNKKKSNQTQNTKNEDYSFLLELENEFTERLYFDKRTGRKLGDGFLLYFIFGSFCCLLAREREEKTTNTANKFNFRQVTPSGTIDWDWSIDR